MANTFPIIQLHINNEIVEFRDKAVIEAEAVQEIHPVGIELPSSTARIRVWLDNTIVDDQGRTIRDKFSPFSDGVYYQSMTTGLIVDIRESMGGVEHMVGRFYLQEWRNPKQGELELVCVDAIGTLDNKTYLGNFYELPTPVSTITEIPRMQSETLETIADKTGESGTTTEKTKPTTPLGEISGSQKIKTEDKLSSIADFTEELFNENVNKQHGVSN